MNRRPWLTGVALMPLLAFGACAVQPPAEVLPSSEPSVSTSTPLPPSAVTGSPIPTPIATFYDHSFVLGATMLGDTKFGTAEGKVTPTLTDTFGDPTDVYRGPLCEGTEGSPYSATYTYGGLSVIFLAKDSKKNSPRTLAGWSFDLSTTLADPLALENDLPADPTFAQLQADYPSGKLVESPPDTVFTLPDGVRFYGEDEPDSVAAGPTC